MVIFKFGDKTMNFDESQDYISRNLKISKHTSEELISFDIKINIKGKENKEEWLDIIKNSNKNPIKRLDESGNVIGEYIGNYKGISYQNEESSDTIYATDIELVEKEQLDIDKLIIGDIETVPYKYKEEFNPTIDDEYLIIEGKTTMSDDESFHKFKEYIVKSKYFSVVRVGINEDPLQMRFGNVIWSENENTQKIDFVLVEKKYDEITDSSIKKPQLPNITKDLAYKSKFLDELIELLIDKEIITEEEISALENTAKTSIVDEYFKYFKVKDID